MLILKINNKENQKFTEISCPEPKSPENGDAQFYKVTQGGKVKFTCDAGYSLDGQEIITCGADGSWDHFPPRCIG